MTDDPDGVAVIVVVIMIIVGGGEGGGGGENGGAISPICWHEEETLSELILELRRFHKRESFIGSYRLFSPFS